MRNLQITNWRGTKTTFSKESRQVEMEEKKQITWLKYLAQYRATEPEHHFFYLFIKKSPLFLCNQKSLGKSTKVHMYSFLITFPA